MKLTDTRFTLLASCLGALILTSCDNQQGDPKQSSNEGGQEPLSETGEAIESSLLAYQESVRAGMDNLALRLSIPQEGQREVWDGRLTMVKDRFATVLHPTSEKKEVHLRRWANVHILELPKSGEPRINKTEDSPLTGQKLVANRLDAGDWEYQFAQDGATPEQNQLLRELDRVEAGVAQFYHGHDLDVGQSWQVPVEALVRWFGDEVDGYAGDINVSVDRLETEQGELCAVLVVSFKATGTMHDPDGQTLDMTMDAAGEIWRSSRLEQDLKVEINGVVSMNADVPTQDITMKVEGPLVITEERKLRS